MAITCPNKKDPQWIKLVEVLGSEDKAYLLWNEHDGNVPEEYYKPIVNTVSDNSKESSNVNNEVANIKVTSTLYELEPNITEEEIRLIHSNYVSLMNRQREGKSVSFDVFKDLLSKYQVLKHKNTYIFGQYDTKSATFITRMNSSPTSKILLADSIVAINNSGLDVISFVPKDYADKLKRSGYSISNQGFEYNFKGEQMIKYAAVSNERIFNKIFNKTKDTVTNEELEQFNHNIDLKYQAVEISVNDIIKAGKDLASVLETYLNKFGIKVEQIQNIKDKLNIDELGFADLLNKIAFVENKKDIPPIAGEFIAYMMQYNPLVQDIIEELSNTEKYKELDKRDYFKIIGELIAKDLQNKLEGDYSKSLIDKIKDLINKFLELIKQVPIDKINTNIGIISNNILQQNKKLVTASLYKPGAFGKKTKLVSIEDALKKDKFGASIVYKLAKQGFILTGSTALSEQGTILRPDENPLHDIDWVSPFKRKETINKFLESYPDAIKVRDIYGDNYVTDSYLIAPEGYEISNYEVLNFGDKIIIKSYDILNEKGAVVGSYRLQKKEDNNQLEEVVSGIEGKVIDFFSYETFNELPPFEFKSNEGTTIKLSNWKSIFKAKLQYARYKDIWDYNRFNPNDNLETTIEQSIFPNDSTKLDTIPQSEELSIAKELNVDFTPILDSQSNFHNEIIEDTQDGSKVVLDSKNTVKLQRIISLFKNFGLQVKIDNTIKESGFLTKEDGKPTIYLNPDKLQSDTILHEGAHLLIDLLGGMSNFTIKKGRSYLEGSAIEQEVLLDIDSFPNSEAADKEILAIAIGKEANEIFDIKQSGNKLQIFKNWLSIFYEKIKDKLGLPANYVKLLANDLVNAKEEELALIGEVSEYKQSQVFKDAFDIFNLSNKVKIDKEEKVKTIIEKKASMAEDIINRLTVKVAIYAKNYNKAQAEDNIKEEKDIRTKLKELLDELSSKTEDFVVVGFINSSDKALKSIEKRIKDIEESGEYNVNELLKVKDYLAAYSNLKEIDTLIREDEGLRNKFGIADTKELYNYLNNLVSQYYILDEKLNQALMEYSAASLAKFSTRETSKRREELEKQFREENIFKNSGFTAKEYSEKMQQYISSVLDSEKEELLIKEKEHIKTKLKTVPKDINSVEMWITDPKNINDTLMNIAGRILDMQDYKTYRLTYEAIRESNSISEAFNKESTGSEKERYSIFLEDEYAYNEKTKKVEKTGNKLNRLISAYISYPKIRHQELWNDWAKANAKAEKAKRLGQSDAKELAAEAKKLENKAKIFFSQNFITTINNDGETIHIPIAKWKNTEQLNQVAKFTTAQKDMFNLLKDLQEKSSKLYGSLASEDLAYVRQGVSEQFRNNGLKNTLKEFTEDLYKKNENDTEFGEYSEDDKNSIRLKDFLYVVVDEQNKLKNFVPIHFRQKIDEKNRSYDLISNALLNYHTALNYSHKTAVKGDLEALKLHMGNRQVGKTINGKSAYNATLNNKRDENVPYTSNGWDSNLYKAFESMLDSRLYGIKSVGDPKMNKIVGSVMAVTGYMSLTFNWLAGGRNILNGKTLTFIEKNSNGIFDKNALIKGDWRYTKDLPNITNDGLGKAVSMSITNQLLERFGGLNDWNVMSRRFGDTSRFSQLFKGSSLSFINSMGEHMMQSQLMYAMLESTYITDKEGNKVPMIEAYELDKEGILKIKPGFEITESDEFDVSQKIRRINTSLFGNYDSENQAMAQRTAIGKLAFMFRKWMPGGFKRRWRGFDYKKVFGKDSLSLDYDDLYYSEQTKEFETGMYTTFLSFVNAATRDYKNLTTYIGGSNWDKMNDVQKSNVLRATFELGITLLTLILGKMLAGLGSDAEDDEKSTYYLGAFYSRSLASELMFYYNPQEFFRLMRSPTAVMGTLESVSKLGIRMLVQEPLYFFETGEFGETYEGGRYHGDLKIGKDLTNAIGIGYKQLNRTVQEAYEFMY